jgi:hypothetical protein
MRINSFKNFKMNENIEKVENGFRSVLFNKSSIPVQNNPQILKWLCDNQTKSYQNKEKNLLQNLIPELTELFGNPNKTLRLESKLWILKYNDLTFNVFTAKGKGTSIEVCDYSHDDINSGVKQTEIIQFLEELHRLINQ